MKIRVLLVVLCVVEVIILVAQPGTGWARHDWGAESALALASREPTPGNLEAAAARRRVAARRQVDERVWAGLLLLNAVAIALVGLKLARGGAAS